jgi:hypothetical protein
MRLLELFSGTGSVGEVFRAAGWATVSVDISPSGPCDIVGDILQLDPNEIDRIYGPFDAIWASPPCTEYSIARTVAKRPRDLEGSDRLVRKAREFIDVIQPDFWWIENPYTGLLKSRPVVADLGPPTTVDYCMHGAPYRKRTALWTNTNLQSRLCDKACGAFADGRHSSTAQRAPSRGHQGHRLAELHRVPRALVEACVAACV